MMETIHEIRVPKSSLPKLIKIKDLIFYEGPLLSHYKSSFGEDFLFYWVDSDDKFNRWLVFRTSDEILKKYLSKEITLLDVISDTEIGIVFKVDVDNDLSWDNISIVEFKNLPKIYLPSDKSFYNFTVITSDEQLDVISNVEDKGVLQAYFNNSSKIGKGTIDLDMLAESLNDFSQINKGLSRLFIIKEREEFKKDIPKYSKKREHRFDETPYLNATKFTYFGNTSNSFGALFKTKASNNDSIIEEQYIKFLMNFFELSNDAKKFEVFFKGMDKAIINSFKNLLSLISKTKIQFDLNYVNNKTRFKASEKIDYENAEKILYQIENLSGIETEDLKCSGRFTALNLITGSYRFSIYDEQKNEVAHSAGYLDSDRLEMAFKIKWEKTYNVVIERKVSRKIGQKKKSVRDLLVSFAEE